MGIDITAEWPEQSDADHWATVEAWPGSTNAQAGYIFEACHGGPYPSQHLVQEAFEAREGARIPAATLRKRLPKTLRLLGRRLHRVYGIRDTRAFEVQSKPYREFVSLCEHCEAATGEPATVFASW